ncbi:phage minor head protein [Methylobacterium aquaticum]|uniref:phage head morphogenesis protein n=1 Tax=Methylobacterium aquaticum TaxID=270351 RepID=UPI00069D2F18|nr:phage minor head protein [Methylobacterium aquaticum]
MPQATIAPLPPAEAIAALAVRGQSLEPTFDWRDLSAAEHARAFTVAKSTGFDILRDVYEGAAQALAEGRTLQDFARDLRPTLEAKGWWGRKEVTDPATGEVRVAQLGSIRRLRTIFDTNLRVSYAAGHWAQFERNRTARPILRYVAVLDGRVRPAHALRHNVALPIDDPFWDTWAPPCGWGCRCTLQSLSLRDFAQMRGELKTAPPPDTWRTYANTRTGEVTRVPDGIDPGWGYNPGKAGWRASVLADKLAAAPPRLAAAAAADPSWPAPRLADEFGAWFDKAASGLRLEQATFTVGAMDRATLDGLAAHGVEPASGAITMQMQRAGHLVRPEKTAAGKAVPVDVLRRMPELLAAPRAVLLDRRGGELLYVFDVPGDARSGKLVVRVDVPVGVRPPGGGPRAAIPMNVIVSAGMVEAVQLSNPGAYVVLSGAL